MKMEKTFQVEIGYPKPATMCYYIKQWLMIIYQENYSNKQGTSMQQLISLTSVNSSRMYIYYSLYRIASCLSYFCGSVETDIYFACA